MRAIKRWRYYCDFCKKATGTRHSMAKHEKGCTANPGRVCGLCALAGQPQRSMAELLAKAYELFDGIAIHDLCGPKGDEAAKAFREFAGNCPACILAALRQSDFDVPWIQNFDFRTESRAFLAKCAPPEDWY